MEIALYMNRSVQIIDATFDLSIIKFLPERFRVRICKLVNPGDQINLNSI